MANFFQDVIDAVVPGRDSPLGVLGNVLPFGGGGSGGLLGGLLGGGGADGGAASVQELPGMEFPDLTGPLNEALALSERLFNEARTESQQLLSPFIQAGTEAIPGVQQAVGGFGREAGRLFGDIQAGEFDPRGLSFTVDLDSPEFQSILEGGTRAIDAAAATQGLLGSGARVRDLTEFGQQAANQFTQDVLNRRLGLSSQLLGQQLSGLDVLRSDIASRQGLLGTGLSAAGQLSGGLLGAAGQQSSLGAGLFGDIANIGLQQQSLALGEQQRQQDLARQQEAQENARRNQLFQLAGQVAGAGIGLLGGPGGAAVGSQLGAQLGGSLA